MTGLTNCSLCEINVSNDILNNDIVLKLILQYVQKHCIHQVIVKIEKKQKNVLTMSVSGNHHILMKQRNAILRALIGTALHGANDRILGGSMISILGSQHGTSVYAATNMSSMISYMSIADQIRNSSSSSNIELIINGLDSILKDNAYIIPYTSTITLADIDMCIALLDNNSGDFSSYYPLHVQRWMKQVITTINDIAIETGVDVSKYTNIITNDASTTTTTTTMPVFFYGNEDIDAVLSALYNKDTEKTSTKTDNATNSNKQQAKQPDKKEQQKQKQKEGKNGGSGGGKKGKAEGKGGGGGGNNNTQQQQQQQEPTSYDVTALDIRVGKIIKVWEHETAEKLFCEEIDIGNGEIRQIASGLRPFYKKKDDLQDRMVLVLCNLKKRNLVGFPSHGMVLCASNIDHSNVEFVIPPDGSVIGERITFDGLSAGEPEPENKINKKKIFEQIAPDLKTNENGIVVWKNYVAKTSTGPVCAINKMPNASVS